MLLTGSIGLMKHCFCICRADLECLLISSGSLIVYFSASLNVLIFTTLPKELCTRRGWWSTRMVFSHLGWHLYTTVLTDWTASYHQNAEVTRERERVTPNFDWRVLKHVALPFSVFMCLVCMSARKVALDCTDVNFNFSPSLLLVILRCLG